MAKPLKAIVRLQIEAEKATPGPPIGPALGQHGINIADFCKQFNAATKEMKGDTIPVVISIYEDRSFTFILKTPPASALIKKAIGLEKGSGEPNKKKVGKITKAQIATIVERKKADFNTDDPKVAEKIVAGTARSMGVDVE